MGLDFKRFYRAVDITPDEGGYAVVLDESKQVLSSIKSARVGAKITAVVKDGRVGARVESKEATDRWP